MAFSSGSGRSVWDMAILRGRADPKVPGQRGAIVRTPRRGNDKLAQGRASRRSRDAPPWVARPTQDPSPRRGTTRPRTGCDHEPLRTGYKWMASIRGLQRATTNGNESATFRVIPEFESFRFILNHFDARFRASMVRLPRLCIARLPRAALGGCAASLCPGLTCFAPSGQGGFLTHGRLLRGWWIFGPPRP
jgi:hypothetical protein